MSKREVPKLNKENFLAWKSLMKLHLGGFGNHAQSTITNEHVDPTRALTAEDLKREERTQSSNFGDFLYPKLCCVQ